MGCCSSKSGKTLQAAPAPAPSRSQSKTFRKPKWKSTEPITSAKLEAMCDEFWDTAPHYGGSREIWDALKAAAAADLATALLIVESAGIIVAADDMTLCYDERGAKYELPKYVLSPPVNLIKEKSHPNKLIQLVANRSQ